MSQAVAVARGDGIGPEIMGAVLQILKAAGAPLEYHEIEIGEKVYLSGTPTGIAPETWETLRGCKAFLKAPITTPQGGGFKSLNVTIRTTLGLYANIRPCVAYHPFISTKHPGMDVVVVRENEEDLYTGIEYRQSQNVYHALKTMSRQGCEKIVRYAFEYAKANKRQKVTCFTKDNILKLTDGLFHEVFDTIAKEYPEIENEHWIIDIGAAKLADTPTAFDVVVMPNLYGDILSDIAAQIAGSVGLAGSANIGEHGAMFEAIHGSAPRRAGQNLANPSGLLLGAIQMLVHLGFPDAATLVHNAWLKTIEEGIHTYDIFKEEVSREKVGTKEFAKAVAERLGKKPDTLKSAHYGTVASLKSPLPPPPCEKELVGVDIFFDTTQPPDALAQAIQSATSPDLQLTLIGNRGTRTWPHGIEETYCVDQSRCRFMAENKGGTITISQVISLLTNLSKHGLNFTHIENLYRIDGESAYTVAQDEQ